MNLSLRNICWKTKLSITSLFFQKYDNSSVYAYQNLFLLRQLCHPCFSLRNTMCVIWINKFMRWEGFRNHTITEPKGIKMMLNQA